MWMLARWVLLLIAVWLILTAGNLASWLIGLPFIAIAILLKPSTEERPELPSPLINIIAVLQFGYFFTIESLRGGIDVSRRVLARQTRTDPVFYSYSMQLKLPQAQQIFISCISLLPGTLCADVNSNRLKIHTLDRQTDTTKGIKRLESLVAKIFGEAY
jgi:multicomponent Na+:H+ antiporter subunit E